MGWIDDRIYCHPKVLRVSKPARWTYVAGLAFSSGWGTRGVLENGALEAIGCDRKHRAELVATGLWDEVDGVVLIHDWDEHNGKRDARREADRERKRLARSTGQSTGTSAGQTADTTRTNERTTSGRECVDLRAPDDGSEGSDGSRTLGALPPSLQIPPTQQSEPRPGSPKNGSRPPDSIDGLEPLAAVITRAELGVEGGGTNE